MAANDMVDHAARLEKMLKLIDNKDPYEMLGIDVSATQFCVHGWGSKEDRSTTGCRV
jgi:hypothetical protein